MVEFPPPLILEFTVSLSPSIHIILAIYNITDVVSIVGDIATVTVLCWHKTTGYMYDPMRERGKEGGREKRKGDIERESRERGRERETVQRRETSTFLAGEVWSGV